MLGEWADAETLRQVIMGAIVVLGLLAAFVVRVVRRMLIKLVLLALIVAFGVSLWMQRADLADCVDTCSCRLYGQVVDVPADANPNCSETT